jgi:hypothetical protein
VAWEEADALLCKSPYKFERGQQIGVAPMVETVDKQGGQETDGQISGGDGRPSKGEDVVGRGGGSHVAATTEKKVEMR